MTQNIIIPDIGDFESVEVIEVLVKVGDQINKDDPIVTLESDKSSVEVPSPFSGKISELKVKIGDKVSKGSLLAKLENDPSINNIENSQKGLVEQETSPAVSNKNTNIDQKKIIKNIIAEPSSTEPSTKEDIDPVETQEWM
jgi:pyruvate dehydrogenase E1 component